MRVSLILVLLLLVLGLIITRQVINNSEKNLQLFLNSPLYEGPSNTCNTEICIALIEEINNAQISIDFAVYGFREQDEILLALKKAKERGVKVRGIVDMDIYKQNIYSDTDMVIVELGNIKSDYFSDLIKLKLPQENYLPKCERPEGTSGPVSCFSTTVDGQIIALSQASKEEIPFVGDIMHNKFFIFDSTTVWTGSANISDSGTGGYNANVVLLLKDKDIASWYEEEFNLMYEDNLYHLEKNLDKSSENNENNEHKNTKSYNNEGVVSVYFSPKENLFNETIIKKITESEDNINISIFFLTHKKVTEALIEAHNKGVDIRIIIDATGASNEYSKHQVLRFAGIEVKVENFGGKMHAKVASFDDKCLIIGSTNWTLAGETKNDENMVIVENVGRYAKTYNKWFDSLWESIPEEFLTKRPLPESLLSGNSCFDGTDNDFDGYIDSSDFSCKTETNAYIVDPNPLTAIFEYPINKDDCPQEFPIKGNRDSYIYHLPSDEYYEKTDPEMCFSTEENAQIAGFRRAKK